MIDGGKSFVERFLKLPARSFMEMFRKCLAIPSDEKISANKQKALISPNILLKAVLNTSTRSSHFQYIIIQGSMQCQVHH